MPSLTLRFDNVQPGEQARKLSEGATALGWGDIFNERDRYRVALESIVELAREGDAHKHGGTSVLTLLEIAREALRTR